MQIKLNLYISLILEAVKSETLIKGRIDKATNPQANEVAFQESAGDEMLHERKLMRGIYTSLDKLKVAISDFLDSTKTATLADNTIESDINEKNDTIVITLNVTDRFNQNLVDSLARLCSKYIEDSTLIFWWTAVGNANQVQFYQALLNEDLLAITHAFNKKAVAPVAIPYTSSIELSGTQITLEIGDEETITYSIDYEVKDDIDIRYDGHNVKIFRQGDCFVVKALASGVVHARLYSIHDETVHADLDIVVMRPDGTIPPTEHHKHL